MRRRLDPADEALSKLAYLVSSLAGLVALTVLMAVIEAWWIVAVGIVTGLIGAAGTWRAYAEYRRLCAEADEGQRG